MNTENQIVILHTKPLAELPQSSSIAEITARAIELRSLELGGIVGLCEARLSLGQALTLAHEKLTAAKFAVWLDEVKIPRDLWLAYSKFWQRRAIVRLELTDKLNGQKMLPGLTPQLPTDAGKDADPIADAAHLGDVLGVDFSELPTLRGELNLRERNAISQCREDRRFLELLAIRASGGGSPTREDVAKVKAIRIRLAA